ncbi:hypothetical protein ONZ43_g4131 [Nemania bipapillata]|uniref:Uncharacterized protein n=1 Tax=Nemania bipapillata TaxID=110536 RepID=A0ACC2IRM3_9PEZI|nr:hypothetical protein ONZ43_g4131 [Nemania bipapillata]
MAFISERFGLSNSAAADVYQRNQSSLGPAILAILDNYISLGWQHLPSSVELRQINEQKLRVPWIPHSYFCPIFDTTITFQAAIDVINVLAGHYKKPAYLKHDVAYTIAASEDEPDSTLPSSSQSRTSQPLHTNVITLEEAGRRRASIVASMNHSLASASSAYKRAKSNGLMGQAAAFYAERARSEAANHREALSTEADLRVDQQSNSTMINLHGVSVRDGVRIALERVWIWWESLSPEEKTRKAMRDGGFKVITGLGRHNANGKSPLRDTVFKALADDGWKLEILTGHCVIIGRT